MGMEEGLLDQGLMLMLAGMGTVFAFLTVLVIAVSCMSRLLLRFETAAAAEDITAEEVAAISAAISRHRQQ